MGAPKLTVQNIPLIAQASPQLGEALKQMQTYVNQNTNPTAGNKQSPPSFINPMRPPG